MKVVLVVLGTVASLLGPVALGSSQTPHAFAGPSYRAVVLADSPSMYWRLGESGGATAFDSSGNGRDATILGHPAQARPGAIVDDPDTSYWFGGQGSRVLWTPGTASYRGDFSVEAWVRPCSGAFPLTWFGSRTSLADFGFDIKFQFAHQEHEIQFDVGNGAKWLANTGFTFTYACDWYHVVAVVETGGARVYVNGGDIGGAIYPQAQPLLYDARRVPQIGAVNGLSEPFHGGIDEVAVYEYALTLDQIQAHYQAGIGP